MNKPYLLSLDLGTSSIGYVAFAVSPEYEPTEVIDLGVRIFSDGRDKEGNSLAVTRREARGIRRNRDRGQNRIRRLVKELIECGLLPEDSDQRKQVLQNTCPYQARHLAATEQAEAHTLGRAIFHIGRRRGFRSNRLDSGSEETEYKAKITALHELLEEQKQTLGSYLYQKQQDNKKLQQQGKPQEQKVVRFRGGETDFYADRTMYQYEFEQIQKQQGNQHINDEQWEILKETVFWQYPLKPVAKGKCRFYPEETRAHIDLPISHQFRIYQEVNNLSYISEGQQHDLDMRQKQAIYDALHAKKTLDFKSIAKLKEANKTPYFPTDAVFNLDVGNRSGKLKGNEVYIELGKAEYFGKLIDTLGDKKLNDIIHHLIEPLTKKDGKQVIQDDDALKQWLKEQVTELTPEQITKLCNYKFKRDTASVSRQFMEQIIPILKHGLIYSDAVKKLGLHHSDFETGEVFQYLPYYGEAMPESVWGEGAEADKNKKPEERDDDAFNHGKIANPTVHMALNQLRVVVNRIISKIGKPPVKIHVELTRDLKNSKDARIEINKQNAKNKKENDRIRKFLDEELNIQRPSREDIQKIKLWEELNAQGIRECVFTGKPIPASKLFNGEVEIEHIIPFSRCYDDGMNNKTLAYKSANNKKDNRTPHEAFGNQEDNYNAMLRRALKAFGPSRKYDRFKPDAMEKFYGEEKGGNMIARQLNDTKYISRKAAQYLSKLCGKHNVVSVNGSMTAVLRDVWQLNTYKDRAEGNYREDHRHHIVDAFVVGLTSRSLIQKLNRANTQYYKDSLYHFLKSRAPEVDELKEQLETKLKDVVASYKPDRTNQGSMFDTTAYGKIQKNDEGNIEGVTRKSIEVLSPKEVVNIKDAAKKQDLLRHLTDNPLSDVQELKVLFPKKNNKYPELHQKCSEWSKITGTKKLRIKVQENSIQQIPSAPYKGYAKNSYAYCDIWQVPAKQDKKTGKWNHKYQGDFAAYSELQQRKNNPDFGKPHPAAKKLMRVYKQDQLLLTDKLTEQKRHVRVTGISPARKDFSICDNLATTTKNKQSISINTLFESYFVNKQKQ